MGAAQPRGAAAAWSRAPDRALSALAMSGKLDLDFALSRLEDEYRRVVAATRAVEPEDEPAETAEEMAAAAAEMEAMGYGQIGALSEDEEGEEDDDDGDVSDGTGEASADVRAAAATTQGEGAEHDWEADFEAADFGRAQPPREVHAPLPSEQVELIKNMMSGISLAPPPWVAAVPEPQLRQLLGGTSAAAAPAADPRGKAAPRVRQSPRPDILTVSVNAASASRVQLTIEAARR